MTSNELFRQLPLPERMRLASEVMLEVNRIYRQLHPMAGNSVNEPISPKSMQWLADHWQLNLIHPCGMCKAPTMNTTDGEYSTAHVCQSCAEPPPIRK